MDLQSPWGTGADASPMAWTGAGQVLTARHKQTHACQPSPRLTCSKSSDSSSVASWALQRKEKEPSENGE